MVLAQESTRERQLPAAIQSQQSRNAIAVLTAVVAATAITVVTIIVVSAVVTVTVISIRPAAALGGSDLNQPEGESSLIAGAIPLRLG